MGENSAEYYKFVNADQKSGKPIFREWVEFGKKFPNQEIMNNVPYDLQVCQSVLWRKMEMSHDKKFVLRMLADLLIAAGYISYKHY